MLVYRSVSDIRSYTGGYTEDFTGSLNGRLGDFKKTCMHQQNKNMDTSDSAMVVNEKR